MEITFSTKSIDEAPKGYVRVRLTEEDKGTTRFVREGSEKDAVEWLEIGAVKFAEMNRRKFIVLCRAIVQTAKKHGAKKIAIQFDATPKLFEKLQPLSAEDASTLAAQNFEMANFEFVTFKTKPKDGFNSVEEILVCGASSKSIEAAAKRGQTIGMRVNATRELANTPGGSMTPRMLAKAAKDAVKGFETVTVKTLGRAEIEKLGMGALAAVGSGSTNEPTFTIMEYAPAGTQKMKPIVLAGKGITFDSGGLNLKPSAHIYEMHMDMSGGAAVIQTVALAAELKLKKRVIGLIAAAENMPGNNAMRPADIVKTLSGQTVEISDTDAEGRLVLCDAITYAKRFNPAVVIDVATLTGAAMSALGLFASGLLTRNDVLSEQLLALGETSGDYLWRLPLWDEFEPGVKGDFSDIVNYPTNPSYKYGGATNGAMFLWQFAKELDCPWAHLDIAPRMTAAPGEELSKGAAGTPVRLLLSFIETWEG